MKKLMIVESPNKIKKITEILRQIDPSNTWKVSASVGHISDLVTNKGDENLGIKFENWEGIYEISPEKIKVVNELKRQIAESEEVYLATDPDREGEAIAWHLKEFLRLRKYKRVSFSEISPESIKKSIDNPSQIDDKLVDAQEVRRLSDRLIGFKGSKVIRNYDATFKSVGRVQTAALRVVVNRESEIANFQSKSYKEFWLVDNQNISYKLHLQEDGKLKKLDFLELEADDINSSYNEIKNAISNGDYEVAHMESTDSNVNPPSPFTTNDILSYMVTKYNVDTEVTTKNLQSLFESGKITYLRTDSYYLDPEWVTKARTYLNIPETEKYKSKKSKGNAQEAHEAIRPVYMKDDGNDIQDEKLRELYQIIFQRTHEAISHKGIDKVQTIVIVVSGYIFVGRQREIIEQGWRGIYSSAVETSDRDEEYNKLYSNEDDVSLKDLKFEEKKTKPKPHFNEGSFLKELESSGIGRPSTYASIIKTLKERGYVTMNKKQFISTELGNKLIEVVSKAKTELFDIDFTQELEIKLDSIANGSGEKLLTLDRIKIQVDDFQINEISESNKCPNCGNRLFLRKGSKGDFFGCSNYPNCKFTRNADENKKQNMNSSEQKKGQVVYDTTKLFKKLGIE